MTELAAIITAIMLRARKIEDALKELDGEND